MRASKSIRAGPFWTDCVGTGLAANRKQRSRVHKLYGYYPAKAISYHRTPKNFAGQQTMKIAQVAPLAERVPPIGYGGTERIVAYLSDELICQGHEITLFASDDSQREGRLIAGADRALHLDSQVIEPLAHDAFQLEQVVQRASEFDIVHFHTGYLHFSIFRRQMSPRFTGGSIFPI